VVHADQEIGVIRPELHSHFAEHLGSCVYGGIWVGKNSPVHDPDINAYNSFDNPNRVVIRPHPVAVENGRIRVTLPAMSVATVTLQVA
jgi:alpha-L-arabinofuranosidase